MATQPVRPGVGGKTAVAAVAQATQLGLHHRIDLDETLAAFSPTTFISEVDMRRVRADVRTTSGKLELHPLILVANLKLADIREPGKPLSLEVLTQWLAGRARLPYLKIDPMKIDVPAVTQVVSHAYALRYRILPVAVSELQVVFATSEPFDTRWMADLGHILRRDIQRMVASPIDISRFLTEGGESSVRSSAPGMPRRRRATARPCSISNSWSNWASRRSRCRRSPRRANRRLAAAIRFEQRASDILWSRAGI